MRTSIARVVWSLTLASQSYWCCNCLHRLFFHWYWADPRGNAIRGQPVERLKQASMASPSSKNSNNLITFQWKVSQRLNWEEQILHFDLSLSAEKRCLITHMTMPKSGRIMQFIRKNFPKKMWIPPRNTFHPKSVEMTVTVYCRFGFCMLDYIHVCSGSHASSWGSLEKIDAKSRGNHGTFLLEKRRRKGISPEISGNDSDGLLQIRILHARLHTCVQCCRWELPLRLGKNRYKRAKYRVQVPNHCHHCLVLLISEKCPPPLDYEASRRWRHHFTLIAAWAERHYSCAHQRTQSQSRTEEGQLCTKSVPPPQLSIDGF